MQAGTLLAQRYRIDGKLGEGGMGVVVYNCVTVALTQVNGDQPL